MPMPARRPPGPPAAAPPSKRELLDRVAALRTQRLRLDAIGKDSSLVRQALAAKRSATLRTQAQLQTALRAVEEDIERTRKLVRFNAEARGILATRISALTARISQLKINALNQSAGASASSRRKVTDALEEKLITYLLKEGIVDSSKLDGLRCTTATATLTKAEEMAPTIEHEDTQTPTGSTQTAAAVETEAKPTANSDETTHVKEVSEHTTQKESKEIAKEDTQVPQGKTDEQSPEIVKEQNPVEHVETNKNPNSSNDNNNNPSDTTVQDKNKESMEPDEPNKQVTIDKEQINQAVTDPPDSDLKLISEKEKNGPVIQEKEMPQKEDLATIPPGTPASLEITFKKPSEIYKTPQPSKQQTMMLIFSNEKVEKGTVNLEQASELTVENRSEGLANEIMSENDMSTTVPVLQQVTSDVSPLSKHTSGTHEDETNSNSVTTVWDKEVPKEVRPLLRDEQWKEIQKLQPELYLGGYIINGVRYPNILECYSRKTSIFALMFKSDCFERVGAPSGDKNQETMLSGNVLNILAQIFVTSSSIHQGSGNQNAQRSPKTSIISVSSDMRLPPKSFAIEYWSSVLTIIAGTHFKLPTSPQESYTMFTSQLDPSAGLANVVPCFLLSSCQSLFSLSIPGLILGMGLHHLSSQKQPLISSPVIHQASDMRSERTGTATVFSMLEPQLVAQRQNQRYQLFHNKNIEGEHASKILKFIGHISALVNNSKKLMLTSTDYSYWCIKDSLRKLCVTQYEDGTPTIVDTIHVIERDAIQGVQERSASFANYGSSSTTKTLNSSLGPLMPQASINYINPSDSDIDRSFSTSLTTTIFPTQNLFFSMQTLKLLLEVKRQRDLYTIRAISSKYTAPYFALQNQESLAQYGFQSMNQYMYQQQSLFSGAQYPNNDNVSEFSNTFFENVERRPLLDYFKIYGVNMFSDTSAPSPELKKELEQQCASYVYQASKHSNVPKSELMQILDLIATPLHIGKGDELPCSGSWKSASNTQQNEERAGSTTNRWNATDLNSLFASSACQLSMVRVYLETLVSFVRATTRINDEKVFMDPGNKDSRLTTPSNKEMAHQNRTMLMKTPAKKNNVTAQITDKLKIMNIHLLEYSFCNTTYILPLLSRTLSIICGVLPLFAPQGGSKAQGDFGWVKYCQQIDNNSGEKYVIDPLAEIREIPENITTKDTRDIGALRIMARCIRLLIYETLSFFLAFDIAVHTNTEVELENASPRLNFGAQVPRSRVTVSPSGNSSPDKQGQDTNSASYQELEKINIENDTNAGLFASIYGCNLIFVKQRSLNLLLQAMHTNVRTLNIFKMYNDALSMALLGKIDRTKQQTPQTILAQLVSFLRRARCVKILEPTEEQRYAKYRISPGLETQLDLHLHRVLDAITEVRDIKRIVPDWILMEDNQFRIFSHINDNNLFIHIKGLFELYCLSASFEFTDRVLTERSFKLKEGDQKNLARALMTTSGLSELLKAPFICLHRSIFKQLDDNNLPFACTFYPSEEYRRILVEQTEYDIGLINVYLAWVG